MSELMYNKLAKYTDLLYTTKNYKKEVDFILKIIKKNKIKGKTLIDIACGSGNHLKLFQKKGYKVYGVDSNKGMLKLTKKNVPKIRLYNQDMRKLNLKIKADVIICMFNSINYNMNYTQFKSTLKNFYNHLNKGGIVIFDSLFTKDNWMEGYFDIQQFTSKKVNICKTNKSSSKNSIGYLDQVYIIYDHGKRRIFKNINKIFIFDKYKIKKMMEKIGFKTKLHYDFAGSMKDAITIFTGIKKHT